MPSHPQLDAKKCGTCGKEKCPKPCEWPGSTTKDDAFCHGHSCSSPKREEDCKLDDGIGHPHIHDKPERCEERWEKIPMSSDHLWPATHKGLPGGNCLNCGVAHLDYEERAHKRSLELLSPEAKVKNWEEEFRKVYRKYEATATCDEPEPETVEFIRSLLKSHKEKALSQGRREAIEECVKTVEDLRIGCTQYGSDSSVCDGDCHACNFDEAVDKAISALSAVKPKSSE